MALGGSGPLDSHDSSRNLKNGTRTPEIRIQSSEANLHDFLLVPCLLTIKEWSFVGPLVLLLVPLFVVYQNSV